MAMMREDLGRNFYLDVCANGSVHIREKGHQIEDGLLPVFSTDTHEEAEKLRVRHCRLARDGSGLYFLSVPPQGVEDLGRVSDLFRKDYGTKVSDDVVRENDLREGGGTHKPRVRVVSIDETMGDAECILVRSGHRKTIRLVTLQKAYKLIQRNYGPPPSAERIDPNNLAQDRMREGGGYERS